MISTPFKVQEMWTTGHFTVNTLSTDSLAAALVWVDGLLADKAFHRNGAVIHKAQRLRAQLVAELKGRQGTLF